MMKDLGNNSRALGGGYVNLYNDGLNANDWNNDNANHNVGCAGSGAASRNFYLLFLFFAANTF